MALGKPVIATNGGGTQEILADKKTGFLIPPSDPVELSKKLEELLSDAELRNSMGLAGKQRILDLFSMDEMVSKYISTYEKLCLN
jgi:glycosyltransferase involved in cell wall biosynthesis